MVTHSSILAWRIPWTEDPGRLQSIGHKESDTTEATSTHTYAKVTLSPPMGRNFYHPNSEGERKSAQKLLHNIGPYPFSEMRSRRESKNKCCNFSISLLPFDYLSVPLRHQKFKDTRMG